MIDSEPQTPSWQNRPPYSNTAEEFVTKYRAQCACGAVVYGVCADPVDSKLCHCRGCQILHGAPFQWAVIFHKEHVRFVRGFDKMRFFSAETGSRQHTLPCKLSCSFCGSPIADEGRRMFLAFGPLFDFGFPPEVPPPFQPTCHIFYGARVIDMNDNLPKYVGHKGGPLWE
jgi:hypothetical protein